MPMRPAAPAALNAVNTLALQAPTPRLGRPALRQSVLNWAFNFFNSVRVLAYLPTMHAIVSQRDSSQHSIWTWLVWIGANATMAAWVYEHNGHRCDKAVLASVANALVCVLTLGVIVSYRL